MRHPEFPIVSFLSLPLVLCSLPSHIRAGSVSTVAIIAWLGVMSLIRGVNSLVWANNVVVRLEIWCDITTKLTIGFTYAIPAASLCILRHLESIASTRVARFTRANKRRRQCFEMVMCFGIPVLFMALHYIVQGHRFDVIEDLGCSPAQYISVAAIAILWIPPLFLSLIAMVYAGLVLSHFLRHRISFLTQLKTSQSAITPARYLRLMGLAVIEMVWDTGTNIYLLYFNISVTGLRPWISWENVHSNFSRVAVFPTAFFPPALLDQFLWQWWIIPISCLFFFIFLAFGEEAMSDYIIIITWFRRKILRQATVLPMQGNSLSAFPSHSRREQWNAAISLRSTLERENHSKVKSMAWDSVSARFSHEVEHVVLPPVTPDTQSIDATSACPSSERASAPPGFTHVPSMHSSDQPQSEVCLTPIRSSECLCTTDSTHAKCRLAHGGRFSPPATPSARHPIS